MTTERSGLVRAAGKLVLVAAMVGGLSLGWSGVALAGDYGDPGDSGDGGHHHHHRHHGSGDSDRAEPAARPVETHHHLVYAPTDVVLNLCGNSLNDAGSSDNPSYANSCVNNPPDRNLTEVHRENGLTLPQHVDLTPPH